MKRWLPHTVAGQLIVLFVVVLLGAQALNLTLLVGERQLASRSNHYSTVIQLVIDEARMLPDANDEDLPLLLSPPGSRAGIYFLSETDRTASIDDGRKLPTYEERLKEALEVVGLEPVSVSVIRHKLQPPTARDERPNVDGDEAQFRRQGPPPGGQPPGGPRPNAGPGAAGDRGPLPGGGFGPGGAGDPLPGPPPFGPDAQGLEEVVMSVEIEPGLWLNAMVPHIASDYLTNRAVFATVLTLLVAIAALILMSRRIVKPIKRLADAAEQFGRGVNIDPIEESGPDDVRSAARAFNAMQDRLTRLLETQRTMLRAVGHDLRTPITTLRIRADSLPEEHGRDKIISTLNDMTVMTDEMLDWAKDASGMESSAPVDLVAMLASMADDYIDQGKDVAFEECAQPQIVTCRRVSLRRAVGNLIDNALKYGTRAQLDLTQSNGSLVISVEDDGPGIPEDRIGDIFKPFTRLESSRNKKTGGIGLGLSIAQSIVEAHGGRLELTNAPTGGLRAAIILPSQSRGER